jgi:hypothetical protein
VKASGDLKKGNCVLLLYISSSSLPIGLTQEFVSQGQDKQDRLCKNPTLVTFIKFLETRS